jgi:hypothetical protein
VAEPWVDGLGAGSRRDLLTRGGHPTWWLRDYAYAGYRQAAALLSPSGADWLRAPANPVAPAVVLLPGVYEHWRFMRPLAGRLHRLRHPVHVVPELGLNSGSIPDMARLVADHLAGHELVGVVVVAHSKGGLIGKYAMVNLDPDRRIGAMVAINTPFAGSPYARWIPLEAVRAFVPTDATLAALAAERAVNARITSVFSRFDPHIPGGSELEGASNVVLATPGHFRALRDPRLVPVILDALRRAQRD